MRRFPRLKPTLWDGVVAACVGLLAVAVLFWRGGGGASGRLTAVVSADGAEIGRVALWRLSDVEERGYSGEGYSLRVAFYPDGVRVLSADCPTQDCVNTGKITRSGQSVVCLPARIAVRLEGGAAPDGAPDAVLG
jgi:hypothetical protein